MARKWLIELRKSKKISQRQAAELAKMKHSQYASLECGEGSLTRTLQKPNGREILDKIIAEYGL